MRETFLPFSRPALGDEEIAELVDSIRSGWITTGPKVDRFASQFAGYVGAPFAAAVSSATAGLRLALLEDAAHAAGTEYKGRKIGSFPTTCVFSFHPSKNITTGEGGMVVTHDAAIHEKVSLLRFHGMDRDAWKRFDKAGSARYDIS